MWCVMGGMWDIGFRVRGVCGLVWVVVCFFGGGIGCVGCGLWVAGCELAVAGVGWLLHSSMLCIE